MADVTASSEKSSPDSDGLLYHYASLDAFKGIIENRLLWATHIAYMNDTSEQELMWELVRRRVDERLQVAKKRKRPRIAGWKRELDKREKTVLYVSCFSEDGGDRLSQWRGYSAGGGVCIGFRKSALEQFCAQQRSVSNVISLHKVRYISPDGDEWTNQQIDSLIDRSGSESQREIFPDLVSHIGARLKHKAFAEENEWRLLMQRAAGKLKHRIRGSLLTPYIELELGDALAELLQTIIVGPSNHKEQTAKAIKGMLYQHGLASGEVKCSDIPYRGF